MDARVAIRYARALFSAAKKANEVARVESDLLLLRQTLRESQATRAYLMSPISDRKRKIDILTKTLGEHVSPLTLQMLRLMVEKRREDVIDAVTDRFIELRREDEKVRHVTVTSREPLSEASRDRLIARLTEISGQTIESEFVVDPEVIGGLKVAYGDYLLDGTLQGSLARLRERVRLEVLKQN